MAYRSKDRVSQLRRQGQASGLLDDTDYAFDQSITTSRVNTSPAYTLVWSSHSRRRRVLASAQELQAELCAPEIPGLERLFVVHKVDDAIKSVLCNTVGIDTEFVEAHNSGARCDWRFKKESVALRWHWEYPGRPSGWTGGNYGTTQNGVISSGYDLSPGWTRSISICRVSLWQGSGMHILFVQRPRGAAPVQLLPPRLRHQDATSNLKSHPSIRRYGSSGSSFVKDPGASSLEDTICETLDGGSSQVGEQIGSLVYDSWLKLFEQQLWPRHGRFGDQQRIMHGLIRPLERNVDVARYLERQGQELQLVRHTDWEALLERVHQRLRMLALTPPRAALATPSPSKKDANERSLDRIAYLGGILLPVTVVSGVLSIEGDYGPEGGNFWVFWVASLIFSLAALAVIYVDQVRRLDVWVEVAADAVLERGEVGRRDEIGDGEDDDVEVETETDGAATYLVQRNGDGSRGRTWRRGELGWGGAVKKLSGFQAWKVGDGPAIALRSPRVDDQVWHGT